MKIDLTSIDLDVLADWDVSIVVLTLMIAFGLVMAVIYDKRRLRLTPHDPFFFPIGDVPNVPMPAGSILHIPAEQSLKFGTGCPARGVDLIQHSARRAAPAGQGSGGDGNHLSGAAAAGPYRGSARDAF